MNQREVMMQCLSIVYGSHKRVPWTEFELSVAQKFLDFSLLMASHIFLKNSCRCPLNIYFDVCVICWNHVRFTLSSLKLNSNNANSELNWTGLVWALYLSNNCLSRALSAVRPR